MKKHNFSAGPAILPQSVIEKAAAATLDLDEIGLSILEISHRSAEFKAILSKARQLVKDLLNLGDNYEVLYLSGGASSQFFMTAMNILQNDQTACFVDTGAWSKKAIKEAKVFGNVDVVASSADTNYNYIPKGYNIPDNSAYLHLTSNNTIFGTQFRDFPEVSVPMIGDMSSDIFSRRFDASKFGVIYAGAQKNMGPAGTTMVVVDKNLLGKVERTIPTMLDYNTHIKKDSAFNTPPVLPIYTCLLTLEWVVAQGGLEAMEVKNQKKADLIYNEIDRNGLFVGTAAKEDRSLMNATFVMKDDSLNGAFLEACTAANISGVKGHRSVGGFRASIYNAMPIESVKVLVDVMQDFEQKHG